MVQGESYLCREIGSGRLDVYVTTSDADIAKLVKSFMTSADLSVSQILMNKSYFAERINLFSFICLVYVVTQILTSRMIALF